MFLLAKNLLCRWHINKNILPNYKKYFIDQEDLDKFLKAWTTICQCNIIVLFDAQWDTVVSMYGDISKLILYLDNTWMLYKDHFVSTWTSKSLNFFNTITSTAEDLYTASKKYLQVSTRDMKVVKEWIA